VIISLFGRLSDRFGRRPIYFVGAVSACTWGFFAFPMMDSGHHAIIMSAVIIGPVFHGLMYAVQPATTAEMFPTPERYSGVSLGYQVTAAIIAVRLLETYNSAVPISWYLAATAAVSAIAVVAVRETKGIDLADSHGLGGHQDLATRRPEDPNRHRLSTALFRLQHAAEQCGVAFGR
jgi:MFS family permease